MANTIRKVSTKIVQILHMSKKSALSQNQRKIPLNQLILTNDISKRSYRLTGLKEIDRLTIKIKSP